MATIFLKKVNCNQNIPILCPKSNFTHTKSQAIWARGSWDNVFTRIYKIQNCRLFCETSEMQRDADYFAVRQLGQV